MRTRPQFILIGLATLALLSTLNLQLSSLFAQGTVFTYNGRLTDGGSPANGRYDLTFNLFATSNSLPQLGGTLTNSATAVSNGLFAVVLDFGADAFPGADRFLEIAARTNGSGAYTPLSPRQRITATPYAITAGNVTGSVAAGQLSGTIAPAQIGAGTITSTMLAANSVTSTQLSPGSVTTSSLADGAVTLGKLNTLLASSLSATFTNPTPAPSDLFGFAVAAVGTDKVLIGASSDNTGASGAGAAYLFTTTGTLLTTFTNPTPVALDSFGISVAAVGTDKVLIGANSDDTGANDAGAAYLFSTGGTLLTTFTNPAPSNRDNFGSVVAAVGTDKVLIGASQEDTGGGAHVDAGVAYLFSTNGALLTTFTHPIPASSSLANFGISVAAVGTDKVLIGAYRDDRGASDTGAAYLFSTNGTLLITLTNPTPVSSDFFGYAVTAVGTDKMLIGAYSDNTGASGAGAAYLFSTNGALLTTFTNPTPAASDFFGICVAAVGMDRVLIGASADATGAGGAGAAYLFSTTGTLFTTFTNPIPEAGKSFGNAMAAVGTGKVLIGAYSDDTGATDAGASYLFDLTSPYMVGLISEGVVDHAITSASLADGAVNSRQLADGAVGSAQLADGSVTTSSLADGAVTLGKLNTLLAGVLSASFTNPTPADFDHFGNAVAAVGTDKVIIGAESDNTGASSAGAAYLYSTSGTLLKVFTNPAPANPDNFGNAVAAVGVDKVLIGAYQDSSAGPINSGAAYLFSIGGALLTTFTNPTPASSDDFGKAVAGVGVDKVLIGAYRDNTGATDAGAAYLFNINGALLTTFTNPTPASADEFGNAVAAVGVDKVLIGADGDNTGATDAGAAYLFSINGSLLTTFLNPTPAVSDQFGNAVTAVGTDKVLIGAANAGAAYLFSTSGALLTTFTNPAPASGAQFGYALAAVGTDKVLIGAWLDAAGAGAAYLFSTTGTLLTTFTNPLPGVSENFGNALAAVGADKVLIGAFGDNTGASGAGAAYLFGLSSSPYVPGLISDGVVEQSITTASLADRANIALLDTAQTFTADKSFGNGAQLLLDVGSRLAPGLAFVGDPNTGVFEPGPNSNTVAIATAGNERMRIDGSGRVGIGTTTPGNKLTVFTPTTSYGIEHTDGNARLGTFVGGSTGGGWLGTISNHKLSFFVDDGSASMTVDTNGNVGIGTTSPSVPLHVAGGTDAEPDGGGYIMAGSITGQNVVIDSNEIMARNNGATATLFLNNDGGRVVVSVLEITGGSDFSENFDIQSTTGEPSPGMVVCIDPANPGQLITSSKAYDRTVAGVVSGAGGVKPGMVMGQHRTKADGAHPVALTGRVYCLVDSASGAVQPGDLITTSDTPGHGMKAADTGRAHGAIIGKAMTPLASGKGLVLVLVSLQ